MTRPRIEPRSPGPLANTLLIRIIAVNNGVKSNNVEKDFGYMVWIILLSNIFYLSIYLSIYLSMCVCVVGQQFFI